MKPKNSPTPESRLNQRLQLTIDSLAYNGGRGVGRSQGQVVFVAATVPGDEVEVRITADKGRYLEAEVVQVVHPSPQRRIAPCPHAGVCGGCSWQHVSYPMQIEQKRKILSDSLRPLQKFGAWEDLEFVPAPAEFHYRNRIQIQIRGEEFGFFAKRSHHLVPIQQCAIAELPLNERLATMAHDKSWVGAKKLEIAVDETGQVHVRAGDHDPEVALFAQVNRAQNEYLQAEVVRLVQPGVRWILDLYSGAGNLTFPLAAAHGDSEVTAVELSRDAVQRGRAKNQPRINWQAGDVGEVLTTLKPRSGFGVVVLDPPRVGAEAKVMDQIRRHRPKQIVYVSCNPMTFARDAVRLLESGVYRLASVRGVDMFPQTEHVELLADFHLVN